MTDLTVVLDFDGLFLDTEWCEYRTVADVFAAHGTELSLELWLTFIGTTDHPHWADVLEAQLGRAIDRPEWVPARRLAAVECARGLDLLPGVVLLLDELDAAGVPYGVASSSPADWVELHLGERGLLDRMATVVTGDEVHRTKPDPALYRLACERLGADPAAAVAIEDSVHGVTAAKAAGMRAVAVPSYLTQAMDFSHADLQVPSCEALDVPRLVALVAGPPPGLGD
ncbi:MAG: HAD family hydrolase [Actinomycetes bacterium]